MKKILLFVMLVSIGLMLQNCATVLSGTKDQITFKSTPPGATIFLNGKEIGTTNNSIIVKRKDGVSKGFKSSKVTYKLEGYRDLTFKYSTTTAGAFWGSIACYALGIVPGAIFTIIDLSTGASHKPKYSLYEKTLEPKK